MAVLKTQKIDLSVLAGAQLYQQFDCYQDDAFTTAFNLTGYTLQATFELPIDFVQTANAPITLTQGSGLTIVASQGLVLMSVSTAGWTQGTGSWALQATDAQGLVSYPLRGLLFVGNP